jgi:hypothetical protein
MHAKSGLVISLVTRIATALLLVLALAACSSRQAAPVVLRCIDVVAGCTLQVDGQPLHIRFSETPRPLRPFDLEVAMAAESIEASFQMQDMEMGFNRYRLLSEAGKWHARIILPACIRGRSDWKLQLDVKTAAGDRRYQLRFTSG